MRAKAGVDERELRSFLIEHRQLLLIGVERERLRIRIVGAFAAERRRAGGVIGTGHPEPAFGIEHIVVVLNLVSQILSMPQYADAASGFSIAECPGPRASGTSAPTGGVMVLTFAVFGSSTGR